jgi:hypothetical protein
MLTSILSFTHPIPYASSRFLLFRPVVTLSSQDCVFARLDAFVDLRAQSDEGDDHKCLPKIAMRPMMIVFVWEEETTTGKKNGAGRAITWPFWILS